MTFPAFPCGQECLKIYSHSIKSKPVVFIDYTNSWPFLEVVPDNNTFVNTIPVVIEKPASRPNENTDLNKLITQNHPNQLNMNAYFQSLLGSNNVRRSQVLLVEDKAALPAIELLEHLHELEDASSSSDQEPRVSRVSLDIRAMKSRHSFNQEDNTASEDLDSAAWILNLSESSIGSRQCNETKETSEKSAEQ